MSTLQIAYIISGAVVGFWAGWTGSRDGLSLWRIYLTRTIPAWAAITLAYVIVELSL